MKLIEKIAAYKCYTAINILAVLDKGDRIQRIQIKKTIQDL